MTHRDYLAANLAHEAGCGGNPVRYTSDTKPPECTCPVADILAAWDAREAALNDVDTLIRNSTGVVGLHMNGDVAEWDSLLATGRLEEWLGSLDAALKATP